MRQLHIRVEAARADGAALRVPAAERLPRIGGVVRAQATMALADTAMALAVAAAKGALVPMTTVAQSSACRPARGGLAALARIVRRGRTLAHGESTPQGGEPRPPVAHMAGATRLVAS